MWKAESRVWLLFVYCIFGIFGACTATDNPIEQALRADEPALQVVMQNLPEHQVQVLFTEIERDADGSVTFREHSFGLDDNRYFYPASTAKLPVALLALEKLQELEGVDRHSRYTVGEAGEESSFTEDLIALFVVSDNPANNRLYEFLGNDEINLRLRRKGLRARIAHRLGVRDSDSLLTRAITFSRPEGGPLRVGPIDNSPIEILPLDNLLQGSAHIADGSLIDEPFDFSDNNYLPLSSLHQITQRLVFPEAFTEEERFHLSDEHREFVLNTMRTLPREAGYDESEYPDGRLKYFLFGDSRERIPEHIEIFNKIGRAYGYLTDSAYIVDRRTNREFLISATIRVNANETFNDDIYEYVEIGIPFLAELGRQLVFER
ncbi:MAG: serine hydrolase [Gammaproteobacteria bacterium]|nr:serine hydrolase [Gammaproteobacteria bacterium]MYG95642.1 serine hydrolase [Gammaproteobacteria bacterium]